MVTATAVMVISTALIGLPRRPCTRGWRARRPIPWVGRSRTVGPCGWSGTRWWSCRTHHLDRCGGVQNLRHRQDQRSEEHTSELQSRGHLVCRLLLEKKKTKSENAMQEADT